MHRDCGCFSAQLLVSRQRVQGPVSDGLLVQLTNVPSGAVWVLYAPFLMTLSVWLLAATASGRPAALPTQALARAA